MKTRTLCIAAVLAVISQAHLGAETRVTVDPRIELMGVLQVLGGSFLSTHVVSPYRQEVLVAFGASAKDPAVLLLASMSDARFNGDAVPRVFLALSPSPDLQPPAAFPEDVIERAGGPAELARLVAAVRSFAVASQFSRFFAEHAPTYTKIVDAAEPAVVGVVNEIESYLGISIGNVVVVLAPLLHNGGFGINGERQVAGTPIYAVIGPDDVELEVPAFGPADRLRSLVTHELLHSVINPLTARHLEAVNRLAPVFETMRGSMTKQGYTDWPTTFNEILIRAITVRLTERLAGQEAAAKALENDTAQGFHCLPGVVSALLAYESQRSSISRIEDFLPSILAALSSAPQPSPSQASPVHRAPRRS